MGYFLLTAKGVVKTLKFNMALILLPVCRNTITCLRSAKLNSFVPFDDNINFHTTVAATIVTSIIPCRKPPCRASLCFLNLLIDSLASMHFGICTTFLSLSTSCWLSMVAAFKVLWYLILACDFEVRQTLDKIIDHRVENISGKYSFSSNVHGNRYGVIEAKEGVSNSLIMPAVIIPGDTLDLSTVLFRSRIIFIGTLINSAVA
ncbi:hypothetical protein BC332_34033 [Capsicum chinense]|nr:hypothetical protein BC332_34452 [Capsicum chinense]PHT97042.1 hypothetical protein BC332_34033 [Capsicum chinense]